MGFYLNKVGRQFCLNLIQFHSKLKDDSIPSRWTNVHQVFPNLRQCCQILLKSGPSSCSTDTCRSNCNFPKLGKRKTGRQIYGITGCCCLSDDVWLLSSAFQFFFSNPL